MKHPPLAWWALRGVLHCRCETRRRPVYTTQPQTTRHTRGSGESPVSETDRSGSSKPSRAQSLPLRDLQVVAHRAVEIAPDTPARDRADDFKPGHHLEVGEIKATDNVGRARRHATWMTSPTPNPSRDADNRKARRAVGQTMADLSDTESIGADGMSGYPALQYLEQYGG